MNKNPIDQQYEDLTHQCAKCKACDYVFEAYTNIVDCLNREQLVGYLCEECLAASNCYGELCK